MLRGIFLSLIFIHGLIHMMGFVKAYGFADIKALTLPISKLSGAVWLIAFILFSITGLLYFLKNSYWWLPGLVAVIISQVLIFYSWQDAKFGTIANVIILLVTIIGFANWQFENNFKADVKTGLQRSMDLKNDLITKADLLHLPQAIQHYLNYVGVVGKPKIKSVQIIFEGEMRGKNQDWFQFTSEQYNFFDDPERLFFMKAKVNGLPTQGYHAYKNGKASMLIKLLSLFPVVNLKGEELNEAETVTFFNDLCLFAPATLIDKNIQWEEINDTIAKATFTNHGISISAMLYFNQKGQLINFISEDRTDVSDMKKYTFSTPASNYKNIDGYNLCHYGEAVWHYPDEKFTYGKFYLKQVKYNISKINN